MEKISFDDWKKIDLRFGKINNVSEIDNSEKLYKISVDLGEEIGKKIILAGLKPYYEKEELENKECIVLVNLEPKKMCGIESQGMLLAIVNQDYSKVNLLSPKENNGLELGSRIQ